MTPVPTGWRRARLGDVCEIVGGGTPKTGVAAYWGGDVRWITPADMSADRSQVLHGGARTLTTSGLDSSAARMVPVGAVVISSRAPVGYVAIVGSPLATNQGCKTAVPPAYVDSRYLYWYLIAARADLEARASGTTFKELSAREFAATEFRWPAMKEQRRIVEALEDHLSRLAAADDYLNAAALRLRSLEEQVVLSRLMPIAASRGASAIASGTLPPLPADWIWTNLGDLTDVVGGVTKDAKKQADPSYVEVPYLRVANVQRTRLDLRSIATIRVRPDQAEALRLLPGDVLLNEGGDRDKLARGWVWSGEIDDCVHQNHVFRARPHVDRVRPEWIAWCANTYGAHWAQRHGRQSVNLASISMRTLRTMPIPTPPLPAQDVALSEIAKFREGQRALTASVETARRRSSGLRRALLSAAFSGRLTGPASDLDLAEELASA